MADRLNEISVCICTFKRLDLLKRLLSELDRQKTEDLFTYSIIIADNDRNESARPVVTAFAATAAMRVTYCVEPRQNIALARNKAVANATGHFVAFIDDDEFPTESWLLTLFKACQRYQSAGVQGPVRRHFDETPPSWVIKGNFYERPTYPTGFVLDWSKGRTNNVLVRRDIIPRGEDPFRQEFRTGEDQDFFRRMTANGHVFVWCNEAIAYEVVPPVRWKRSFMIKRALLQGTAAAQQPGFDAKEIAKSLIAIPAYATVLPFAFFSAQHRFMTFLIKLCNHVGKLLALLRISPIRAPYVTE